MTKVLGVAKVHASNKITIPKDLREQLDVKDGNYIKFILEDNRIVVKKLEP
ncbi:MAG: AbrB/MazE/SpoVT family DNA-binding domain-containing protein [Candidatus Peribacteraceae bacterium]|nr:AbrB/MazE/SpoVT family DNA-binding domain-containing protein [Candidatus Peribacteraceae bacterium]